MNVKELFKSKWKDTLLLILIALLLMLAVLQVFGGQSDENVGSSSVGGTTSSSEEVKLAELLSQMQGVGAVDVMIYQTEDGEKSAVIVCDGANDLQVHINVREAAATALGTTQQSIKIYLKR